MLRSLLVAVALLLPACVPDGAPDLPAVVLARPHVLERDGRMIHVWERVRADLAGVPGTPVLVLLHGGTWSGGPCFDLDGHSTMIRFAEEGWDVFAMDAQGYGVSGNPRPESESNSADAAQDLRVTIEALKRLRPIEDVALLGWSWGSLVAGRYAAEHPEDVARLVLYGTRYHPLPHEYPTPTGRVRTNTDEAAREDFIDAFADPAVIEAFVSAALAADAESPNGALRDYFERLPILEPSRLTMPTLVIAGEAEVSIEDRLDDNLDLLRDLATPDKRFVVVPGGGHAVHLERGADRWHSAVLEFLGTP